MAKTLTQPKWHKYHWPEQQLTKRKIMKDPVFGERSIKPEINMNPAMHLPEKTLMSELETDPWWHYFWRHGWNGRLPFPNESYISVLFTWINEDLGEMLSLFFSQVHS